MSARTPLLIAATCTFAACVTPRIALPPPLLPLTAHLALPERPTSSLDSPSAGALVVEDFMLPCGIAVHVVERPDALLGHLALLAGGGYLGDGGSLDADAAMTYALEHHFDAEVTFDTRGVSLAAETSAPALISRATALVRLAAGDAMSRTLLSRAGEATSASWTNRLEHDLTVRVYGGRSAQAAYTDPAVGQRAAPVARLRARIAQVFVPTRMRLVVVGDIDRVDLERALIDATRDIAETPHAEPRTLEPTVWEPPRPQIRGYGGDTSLGEIAALGAGPAVDAAEHAAFRVAVRILGGMYSSRPNQVFREERRETYGAHAVVLDRGTHTVVRFATTVETPQLGDVLDLLLDELARLGDAEALTDEEVERARRLEIATEIERWDDSATLVRRILDARVRGERPSPSRAIEALAAVDRAAVAETARHWLAPHRLAIVAVGQSTWMLTHPLSAPGGYAAAEP
jgi:hypothetical protein